MIETEIYAQAYDDFIASLDISTRDAITKLMIHTKTRPDDPQMLGICLTAIATKKNSVNQAQVLQAQKSTLETLDELTKKGPQLERNLYSMDCLRTSLNRIESTLRNCMVIWGVGALAVGLVWFATMCWAWNTGYTWARNDIHTATHEQVCSDINRYIAQTSSYWRNSLGMTAAADRLGKTEFKDCPR